jgi:hypothetical protein
MAVIEGKNDHLPHCFQLLDPEWDFRRRPVLWRGVTCWGMHPDLPKIIQPLLKCECSPTSSKGSGQASCGARVCKFPSGKTCWFLLIPRSPYLIANSCQNGHNCLFLALGWGVDYFSLHTSLLTQDSGAVIPTSCLGCQLSELSLLLQKVHVVSQGCWGRKYIWTLALGRARCFHLFKVLAKFCWLALWPFARVITLKMQTFHSVKYSKCFQHPFRHQSLDLTLEVWLTQAPGNPSLLAGVMLTLSLLDYGDYGGWPGWWGKQVLFAT